MWSDESYSSSKLKDYVNTFYPNFFIKSNKPYDKGCQLINKKTGKVLLSTDKNYDMLEKISNPLFKIPSGGGLIKEEVICIFSDNLKRVEEKALNKIYDTLRTVSEWNGGMRIIFVQKNPLENSFFRKSLS